MTTLLILSLVSSGVTPIPTPAGPPVSLTVVTMTPPVPTLTAAPAVSMVTTPATTTPAVTPPTAAPAPLPAGACAPTAMAMATRPAAVVTVAPPVIAGGPMVAGAPSSTVGAPPPSVASGSPLAMGTVMVSRSFHAVPAPHHLFLSSPSVLLPVFPSSLCFCSSTFP